MPDEISTGAAGQQPSRACEQHPTNPAVYRCDGCGKDLCAKCVEEGHAVLFCRLCGERAVATAAPQTADPRQIRRRVKREQPYTMADVLRYPFRGMGAYLYAATLAVTALLFILPSCLLRGLFTVLLASLQLRIVRATAEGEDELPDWPDWTEPGERLMDVAVWLVASLLQFLGIGLLISKTGPLEVLLGKPSLGFWLTAAALLWIGTALGIMAFGAAGTFDRIKVASIPAHILGFARLGAEAVNITNWVFGLGALVLVARSALESMHPLVGIPLSGALGAYWIFVQPHLAGVLFRRNYETLEAVYGYRHLPR